MTASQCARWPFPVSGNLSDTNAQAQHKAFLQRPHAEDADSDSIAFALGSRHSKTAAVSAAVSSHPRPMPLAIGCETEPLLLEGALPGRFWTGALTMVVEGKATLDDLKSLE